MTRSLGRITGVGAWLGAMLGSGPSSAQKLGGILHVHALDSLPSIPPSMSMHEEVDAVPARAMMGGLQQTMALSLDRRAFIDIISEASATSAG